MFFFRVLAHVFGWLAVLLIAMLVSAVAHLDTDVGHRAVRQIANTLVTDLIAGRLDIRHVERVRPGGIVVSDVSLYGRDGTRVIQGDRILLVPDLFAGLRGVLRFSHVELRRGHLRLEELPDGTLTFLDALSKRRPSTEPSSGGGLHAYVDDMHLDDLVAYGNLLGARGLHARDVHVWMRMHFLDEMDIRIHRASGRIDGPMDFVASLDDAVARISSDPHLGSTVDARLHYGDERLRAHMTYAVPRGRPDDAPAELDLHLQADPIDLHTIERIGFDWAAPFQGRARGYVRMYGPPTNLRMSANLAHEAGPLVIRGALPSGDDVVIEASTPGIDLSRLVPDVPALPIGGDVRLVVHPESTGLPATVHADLRAFVFEDFAIPTLAIDATLLPDRARIDGITAPYGGTDGLTGSGYASFDGSYQIDLAGSLGEMARDPNVQRFAPGARGRTHVRASVRGANGVTAVEASGRVDDATIGDVHANHLGFRLTSETVADRTRLALSADTVDLRVGPVMLGDGTAHLRSDGRGYTFDGDFYDPRVDGRVHADGRLGFTETSTVLTGPRLHYERRGVTLDLTAERIEHAAHRSFLTQGGELRLDGQRVASLDARWAERGADAAGLRIEGLPLERLTRLFSPQLPDLGGTFDASAALSGDLETAPTVALQGTLTDVRVRTLRDLDANLRFQLERGQLTGGLHVDGGDAGRADVELTGTAAINLPNFGASVREGEYNFHGVLDAIDLGRVAAGLLGLENAGVEGCVDATMDFGGYLAFAPTYDATFSVDAMTFGDSPPFELDMLSRYDGQTIEATGYVGSEEAMPRGRGVSRCAARHEHRTDGANELAEIYANLRVPLLELFDDPNLLANLLQVVPWQLAARVPPRQLGTLPSAWRERFPRALDEFRLGASLSAIGGMGAVQSSVAATLDYVGDTQRFVCARGSYPRFSLVGTHANGDSRAELTTFVGQERVMSAVARTSLPLDEWLASGAMGPLPATSIDAAITPATLDSLDTGNTPSVESSEIPFLCEYFTGPFSGRLGIDGLYTDQPLLSGTIASTELQFRRLERSTRGTVRNAVDETPVIPMIALKFSGDEHRLSFNHDMNWWGEGHVTQMQGYVDWTWNAEHPTPEIADDAPFSVHIDAPFEAREGMAEEAQAIEDAVDGRMASVLPMQILTGWIPLFGQVDGQVEAELDVTGRLDAPRFGGTIAMRNAVLTLAGIGQRLRGVSGRITLDGDHATIRELSVRDEDGTARVTGDVALDGWSARSYTLDLSADDFPVRNEGSIMARLTGHAAMRGQLEEAAMRAEIEVADLDVGLTPPSSQDPISLGEHPDVRIVGLSAAPPTVADPYPMFIHLLQTPRFWVRSEEFAAQVSTDLEVNYDDPDVRISGSLELHRGFFDVFGKRFEVNQGSMAFDGGARLDPQVSLVATHQLRGGGRNDIVVVRASGTLTEPTVEFSSPLVATGDQGQILCILITGNTSGQCGESGSNGASGGTTADAGNQAASFLTGVAFGVATLALREEFGEFIPMLSVESGRTLGSARVRAGFNFDRLIPDALRNVVRGIYVEGYVNAGAQNGASTSSTSSSTTSPTANAQYGFSIELQFPHNIVSEGEYAPPSNWRFGVTWEP